MTFQMIVWFSHKHGLVCYIDPLESLVTFICVYHLHGEIRKLTTQPPPLLTLLTFIFDGPVCLILVGDLNFGFVHGTDSHVVDPPHFFEMKLTTLVFLTC